MGVVHCFVSVVIRVEELVDRLKLSGWVRDETVLEKSLGLWGQDVVGVWAGWSMSVVLDVPSVV